MLPVPRSPDGRTIHADHAIRAGRGGTKSIMPVTNAIEALNAKLRRAVRMRGHFPTDQAALKLLFLVLNLAEREWRMPPREWAMARAQFAILFEDRFQVA
jgi:putative transposase